jgi:hypothetical protein
MKITNRIENIGIAVVTLILSVTLTYMVVNRLQVRPLQKELTETKQMVMELAKLEKYKYEIKNDFEKVKAKDSQVVIQLDNQMDASNTIRLDSMKLDTLKTKPEKKGFFGRLFNNKNKLK